MSKGRRRRKSKAQTGPKAPRQPLLSIRVTVTCWTGTYRRIGGPARHRGPGSRSVPELRPPVSRSNEGTGPSLNSALNSVQITGDLRRQLEGLTAWGVQREARQMRLTVLWLSDRSCHDRVVVGGVLGGGSPRSTQSRS